MPVALQMNERGSEYVPVVHAIIMQGRDMVVAKDVKTFAGPYILSWTQSDLRRRRAIKPQ